MWRDDARILDMLLAAKELANFTNGVTFEAFEHNRLLQHGAVRLIEIMGEAARSVSSDFKAAHPEIPWQGIVGIRNILIHEYFRVAPDKVWEVIEKDLPALIALIEPLVPPESPP